MQMFEWQADNPLPRVRPEERQKREKKRLSLMMVTCNKQVLPMVLGQG